MSTAVLTGRTASRFMPEGTDPADARVQARRQLIKLLATRLVRDALAECQSLYAADGAPSQVPRGLASAPSPAGD